MCLLVKLIVPVQAVLSFIKARGVNQGPILDLRMGTH